MCPGRIYAVRGKASWAVMRAYRRTSRAPRITMGRPDGGHVSLRRLPPFYVALLVGWATALASIVLGLRLRKLGWLVIALVLFAGALTGLAWREHRRLDHWVVGANRDHTTEGLTRRLRHNVDYLREVMRSQYQEDLEPLPDDVRVEVYASGPEWPTGLAWIPGTDDVIVADRAGAIRVVHDGELASRTCATVPASVAGQNDGLLGIELSPEFQQNRWIYTYYTDSEHQDNRIVRFTVTEDFRCTSPEVIFSGIPMSDDRFKRHNGGKLEFAGGHLFVSTGDADKPVRAQTISDLGGKILRLLPDGSIPDDNPFSPPEERSPVWAYGFRNPFGLAVGADSDLIYASDNGPFCDDKVDLVQPGGNYGWGPDRQCGTKGLGDDPIASLITWPVNIAPTDLMWYSGRLTSMRGLLIGDFNLGYLHRLSMSPDGTRVSDEAVHSLGQGYRILDVTDGPGGWPYVVAVRPAEQPTGYILRLVRAEQPG